MTPEKFWKAGNHMTPEKFWPLGQYRITERNEQFRGGVFTIDVPGTQVPKMLAMAKRDRSQVTVHYLPKHRRNIYVPRAVMELAGTFWYPDLTGRHKA